MTEAMQQVRETLGDDAIIVATREEKKSGHIQVTAAVDNIAPRPQFELGDQEEERENSLFGKPGASPTSEQPEEKEEFEENHPAFDAFLDDWLQYDEENEQDAVIEPLTDAMLHHSVPENVTEQVISTAMAMGFEEPRVAMVAALESLFRFQPLPDQPCKKAIMLVGPPGAGKTLTVAKLAARAALKGMKPAIITTDTVRAGGVEQLQAFANILRIDVQKAESPAQLKKLLDENKSAEQIIIDTGGLNPFDVKEMKALSRFIHSGDIEPVMVMPAGTDPEESAEMARTFGVLGARCLIPTRLDIARRIGGLLAAAWKADMSFADASNTAQVAEGLEPVTPASLCDLLLPKAQNQDKNNKEREGLT